MKTNTPTVCMIGLGYIGLPTAALIASNKIQVTGVDLNKNVVDTINHGKIHIVEPSLAGLVYHVVKEGYLHAATAPVESDVYLIAVPTPFKDNHEPDISYVESAVRSLLPTLKQGALVIIESTSPVGTTATMQSVINSERPELTGRYFMAYCPERVLPGNVIHELEQNDRAIGGIDEISTRKAVEFYKLFVRGTLHPTNAPTAEMCKLVENASRDNQIAFANELSMICDKADINVWELIRLANRHPRVNILQPGTGVGGHCIAVDPWFIVSAFPEEAKLIRSAREINNYKTEWVIERIKREALQFKMDNGRDPVIACLGLAFKANIDDLRESPALHVTQELIKAGLSVIPVEPNIESHPQLDIKKYKEAVDNSDIQAILVKHNEFKEIKQSRHTLDFCGIF